MKDQNIQLIYSEFAKFFANIITLKSELISKLNSQITNNIFASDRYNIRTNSNGSKYIYHVDLIDLIIKTISDEFKNKIYITKNNL